MGLENCKFETYRLNWEESQKHYLAIDEIESKNSTGEHIRHSKVSKSAQKRAEAKSCNEINSYLRQHEIEYKMGGFYGVRMVSHD